MEAELWLVVGLGAAFTLARFSEAFLVLRAEDLGLSLAFVPLVMVVMNVFYSGFAYPAGAAADRIGRRGLLLVGLAGGWVYLLATRKKRAVPNRRRRRRDHRAAGWDLRPECDRRPSDRGEGLPARRRHPRSHLLLRL